MPKIFISGGPGSGKTTYAKQLAQKHNIPHFDLDDLKWGQDFGQERPKSERLMLRDKILAENTDWVIEGVYTKDWIIPILETADHIIILKPSTTIRQWRIIKRSFRRILHIEPKTHRETFISLFKLLLWSQSYNKYLPELLDKINKIGKKAEQLKYIPKEIPL